MKHLPNIFTLANLFFGCIAIAFILDTPTFLTTINNEEFRPVLGMEQMHLGSLFIALAALMDVLDGFVARALKVSSNLGKDLDSLADVVSFGVAPSMIMYKLLWFAYMSEPGALDVPLLVTAPAFLIACFGALRLARFNQTSTEQKQYFSGMPIPATGLIVASLPLIQWYTGKHDFSVILKNKWFLYAFVASLCFLMVSKVKFLKWKAPGNGIGAWWPQILMLVAAVIGAPFLNFAIVPVVFVIYLICSLVYRYPSIDSSL
jgi:CDP-diacylglycerol--serine O-phosphatidyltransferase